jgi:peroxiredoxin
MPFPFLIDESREVIKKFDVFHYIGFDAFKIARPSLYLINSKGEISYAYVGSSQTDRPAVRETYEMAKKILNSGKGEV